MSPFRAALTTGTQCCTGAQHPIHPQLAKGGGRNGTISPKTKAILLHPNATIRKPLGGTVEFCSSYTQQPRSQNMAILHPDSKAQQNWNSRNHHLKDLYDSVALQGLLFRSCKAHLPCPIRWSPSMAPDSESLHL